MFHTVNIQSRPSFLTGQTMAPRQVAQRQVAPITISARYRGKGTDLSKVDSYRRHDTDCGSPEVQVARLSARVLQLTAHLQQHKKDYSTRRGLMRVLSQRKQMLIYLQRHDRPKYESVISTLNIRPLKTEAQLNKI